MIKIEKCEKCSHKDVCKHEGYLDKVAENFRKSLDGFDFENSNLFDVHFDCKKYQEKLNFGIRKGV